MSIGEQLPLSAISPSTTNPRKRFNEADLQELAESIKQHGIMQPILVRPTNIQEVANNTEQHWEYEIVAGERRYRASKLAGIEYIPAIIRELTDLETLQLQIIENLQRSDLHPMEEAQGFKALLDNKDAKSWNADELAAKINKSRSYIYGALKLNELCTYAQDQFLDGKFGREIALLIARIPGAKLQEQAAKDIIRCEYSYRAAKDYIRNNLTIDLSKAPWDKISITLYPAAGSCLSCPKRTGNYPELYPDIESPDVCTDTACFAAKKVAYAAEIIATNPRVIHGDEAKKVAPFGANQYVTNGFSSYPKAELNGYSSQALLGDDMPEPYILIDDKSNIQKVYNQAEIETLMKAKLQEKVKTGELEPVKPKEKTQHELDYQVLKEKQAAERERRLHIFNRIATRLPTVLDEGLENYILSLIIDKLLRHTNADLQPVLALHTYEGVEEEFFDLFQQRAQSKESLLTMAAMLLIVPGTELTSWNWKTQADNENDTDYQFMLNFISNLDLNQAEFLTAELPFTPNFAAPASEISAEESAGAETPAPEKAKRGRPAKKAIQEESAEADA